MKKSSLKFLCFMLVVFALASLVACAKQAPAPAPTQPATPTKPATAAPTTPAAATPKSGGVLRIIGAIQPTSGTFGWPSKVREAEAETCPPAIETLLREDKNLKLQPWLATAWQVAPDRLSITFTLRQGVKFHDGTDFNAEAVKFNLDAVKDAKLPATTNWKSVDVIDPYTVKLNLTKWDNSILSSLAPGVGLVGMMVSPTAVKKNGVEWAGQNPVGTGPFKFVSYTRDVELIYTKNPDYWQKGKPYLDGIKYIFITDAMTQVAAFKAGDADMVASTNAKILSELRDWGAELIYDHDGAWVIYPDAANADSPWSNVKVRQAVEYAIDREAITKALGFGIFQPAYQWPRPGATGYINGLGRKYDPEKAKQLLTEAGYANGFKTTLGFGNKDMTLAIQANLAKVGIVADTEDMGTAKYAEYMSKGWHNMGMVNPAASFLNFLNSVSAYFLTPNYYPSLKAPANFKALYDDATTTLTVEPAKAEAVAKAIYDDASIIPMMYMGKGRPVLKSSQVHDVNFFTQSYHKAWTPEDTWMGK